MEGGGVDFAERMEETWRKASCSVSVIVPSSPFVKADSGPYMCVCVCITDEPFIYIGICGASGLNRRARVSRMCNTVSEASDEGWGEDEGMKGEGVGRRVSVGVGVSE